MGNKKEKLLLGFEFNFKTKKKRFVHFQNLAYCSASPIGKERSKENESARIPEEKTPGLTARYINKCAE